MDRDTLKLIVSILAAVAAGYSTGEFTDVLGAKAWKEDNAQALVAAELTRVENARLRAQRDLLIDVLHTRLTDVAVSAGLEIPESALEMLNGERE